MGFIRSRPKQIVVVFALCPLLLLCSCTSLWPTRLTGPGNPLPLLRSYLADPFGSADHAKSAQVASDMTLLKNRLMPASAIAGKTRFTLEDCRSIALANNLDLQVARLEELTKASIAYSNETKLLPHLLVSGDLSERDNQSFAYSDVLGREGGAPNPLVSGTGVTSYSTGHERGTWRYSLEARWSPTDAALAYYLTKSGMNDRVRAHHQKVRVAQKLTATVDAAYFRLLSLQECLPLAKRLCYVRGTIAGKMRKAFEKKIVGVEEYNRAKQNAIRASRYLSKMRNEHERQRNILASAMALSPDYCVDGGFCLIGALSAPCLTLQPCDMELRAVRNRPEALEAGLNHLNSTNDLKRTIIKYFPKISGFWRYTRDKDKYLYNKDWKDVGVAVYFDLLDCLTNAAEGDAARSNVTKTQREVGSVALAITAQVRVAALQYFDALDEVQSTDAALHGTEEVLQVAERRAAKDDLDKLSLEEARAILLQNKIEWIRALGEANAYLAELHGAMGTNFMEPPPSDCPR